MGRREFARYWTETSSPHETLPPALLIVAAGICAALHVAKLPPAIPALQQSLALTLVQAGFLLSLVQLAGMLLAVAVGAWADGWGARRSMLAGLLLLSVASAAGGWADSVVMLMALRAVEGLAFLLVVLPAPGWLRAETRPERLSDVLGGWATYMPVATTLALAFGPWATATFGWRAWWWAMGACTLLMALALAKGTSAPLRALMPATLPLLQRLRLTLSARGPWLVAATFGLYAFQWMAVVGFLPTLYAQAGLSAAATGTLTALVAAVNAVGNFSAGRLMQSGRAPVQLLRIGLVAMAAGSLLLFDAGAALPFVLSFGGALVFSALGGLIPASLFALAVRVAPHPQAVATTIGWVQQCSALGQFFGPPVVAAIATASGGWHFSAVATVAATLLALCLIPALGRAARLA